MQMHHLAGGVLERQHPLAGETAPAGFLGSSRDVCIAQPIELRAVVDDDGCGVHARKTFVPVVGLERGLLFVQRAQRGLVGLAQQRAGADEVAVVPLDQMQRFRIELQRGARVVDPLDAREQLRVQVDLVVMRRQLRRLFAFDLLQRWIGVG